MTALLNNLFIDSFNYFSKKELTIPNALKVTDILLLQLEVNCEDEAEFNSFMDNFIELNSLLSTYFAFLTDPEEVKLIKNENYEFCKTLKPQDKQRALNNLKAKRLALYQNYEPNLVSLVNQFKSEVKLKAA